MNLRCTLFGRHEWTEWESSWDALPRIVKASLEYRNTPERAERHCTKCLRLQSKPIESLTVEPHHGN